MTTDTLRTAITAALRRRGTIDDLDVTPSITLLGSRTSTASVVLYGPDGVVIDVVARAGDDAKALRGVAFACGLREDGSIPAEEVERLTRELAAARATVDQLLGVIGAHGGEVARLQFALASEATRHAETLVAMRVADVASERDALRDELAATRAALRANLRCDECDELATRAHADTARFGCEAHGVGEGWADTTHAAVVREALR